VDGGVGGRVDGEMDGGGVGGGRLEGAEARAGGRCRARAPPWA